MKVAFVTSEKLPGFAPDDRPAAAALAGRGIEVVPVPWSAASVRWDRFDALVLRSTWDYHLRIGEFTQWVEDRRGDRLWNPPDVALWNANKRYLLDVQRAGVPIAPTRVVSRGSAISADALLEEEGWKDAVVKPAVSASAHRTSRLQRGDGGHSFRELVESSDVLVQRFLPEVQTDGEWSLIFFGDELSHAVLKRPAPGDFRVQSELGGSIIPAVPPAAITAAALKALHTAPGPTLYARVDGVVVAGSFVLMELELLEPSLHFTTAPPAAHAFAAWLAIRWARPASDGR